MKFNVDILLKEIKPSQSYTEYRVEFSDLTKHSFRVLDSRITYSKEKVILYSSVEIEFIINQILKYKSIESLINDLEGEMK